MGTIDVLAGSPPFSPLLEIAGLHVRFDGAAGQAAVRGVDLTMGRERLAIVGESGSGKSASVRAVLGLLPSSAVVTADRMAFRGEDLLAVGPNRLRALRGRRIAMVVQDPRQGFNPVRTIAAQLREMLMLHGDAGRGGKPTRDQLAAMLDAVHIRDPERVLTQYPHQLSGGMAQRAMIAMMLAGKPDLLIADEATSALDVVVQQQVLALIDEQVTLRGMGLILISHQLDLVARFADRTLVMYAGRVVETLTHRRDAHPPRHPYTRGLLACRPTAADLGRDLPTLTRDPAWLA
jgi:peptide/nickel transport system ATP-binding protein